MWTEVVDDVADGSWVGVAIAEFATSVPRHRMVGAVLPPVFDAYARLLHRAQKKDDAGAGVLVRWSEVAEHNGRVMHPLVEWASLQAETQRPQPGLWDQGPNQRRPDPTTMNALRSVLTAHTSSGRAWFAVWEGNTALDEIRGGGARLQAGGYEYFVVRDDLSTAGQNLFGVPPSLWWPDDRSWCVASNSDLLATYVGGTHAAIAAILAHPDLEAFPVTATDSITHDSDTVNPPAPKP